jgi:hypothetical protein
MSDGPQYGQVWQLKASPEIKADIIGATTWFDSRFVWLGFEDGRVDSMGEYTFMKYYEKDYSYARTH